MLIPVYAGRNPQRLASADSQTGSLCSLLNATASARLSLPSNVSKSAVICYTFCFANRFIALLFTVDYFLLSYLIQSTLNIEVLQCFLISCTIFFNNILPSDPHNQLLIFSFI